MNCVTDDCLCLKTAYCVFNESTGWYFLEDTNSHHILLYLEVKLCLLPFHHPRVCIVKYSTSSVIPYSPWSFLSFWKIFLLLKLILFVLSIFVLYGLIRELQGGSNMTGTYAACLHRNQSRSYLNHLVYPSTLLCCFVLFSLSILCINDCLYILIFFTVYPDWGFAISQTQLNFLFHLEPSHSYTCNSSINRFALFSFLK